ncbi:hypothetical protein [Pendulispora albinea]
MNREASAAPAVMQLAMAWVLVSVPLAYGLYETVLRAAKLFTG